MNIAAYFPLSVCLIQYLASLLLLFHQDFVIKWIAQPEYFQCQATDRCLI